MDYQVKITEFEGPLDLLLHLIKESNIDIYDISIDEITKQYLDYINKMEELNIDVASSYLVMAAELMEIKSKSLLPSSSKDEESEEEDEEVTRENLIKRLIEYQKYKDIANDFQELENQRHEIYIKLPENLNHLIMSESSSYAHQSDTDVSELLDAFIAFIQRKNAEKPLKTKITNKEYSVKERKNRIKSLLLTKKKVTFDELFDIYNKSYIVVTFLSILELAKENTINLEQSKNFEKIYVELKEG